MFLYVDNSAIIYTEKIIQNLKGKSENELCKIQNWIKLNRLTLNYKKSCCMVFDSSSNKTDKFCLATINGLLESKNATTYLEVFIDYKLFRE